MIQKTKDMPLLYSNLFYYIINIECMASKFRTLMLIVNYCWNARSYRTVMDNLWCCFLY